MASERQPKFAKWRVGERYELEKVLGKGSYGEVALATDRKTKKKVAIKFMEDAFQHSVDSKRTYREMHILRHLRHPNIVELVDIVSPNITSLLQSREQHHEIAAEKEKDKSTRKRRMMKELGELYLIFEYVDTDLAKIFKSDQYMQIGHVQYILMQILLGLKYIHSSSVVHRDIKPANILISCSDCFVKVADFGLARVVGAEEMNIEVIGQPASVRGATARHHFFAAAAAGASGSTTTSAATAGDTEESAAEGGSAAGRDSIGSNSGRESGASTAAGAYTGTRPSSHSSAASAATAATGAAGATVAGWTSSATNALRGFSLNFTGRHPPAPPADALGPVDQDALDFALGPAPVMNLKRQMTQHVVTRWYRAPEVILSEPYTAAVDIWSVGCIFAELLGMIRENVPNSANRRPIFPGESCGELSPDFNHDASFHDGSREQLNIIFNLIGLPLEEDLQKIKPEAAASLRTFRNRRENFSERFPACDASCLDLLTKMLTFNPDKRITVTEALRHPFLSPFFTEALDVQAVSHQPMSIDIESIGEDSEHLYDNIVKEVLMYQSHTVTSPGDSKLPPISKSKGF